MRRLATILVVIMACSLPVRAGGVRGGGGGGPKTIQQALAESKHGNHGAALELFQEAAREFKDWHFDRLPGQTVFSTIPSTQPSLLASRKILGSEQNITPLWLKNRVTTLAATIAYLVESSSPDAPTSMI